MPVKEYGQLEFLNVFLERGILVNANAPIQKTDW